MRLLKTPFLIVLIIGFLLSMLAIGCGEGKRGGPPSGKPSEYFPTSVGTKWVYKIEIGNSQPIVEHYWVLLDLHRSFITRVHLSPMSSQKSFVLKVRVKRPSPKVAGVFAGVELAIEQDGAGVFGGHKKVFWSIHRAQDQFQSEFESSFIVWEIVPDPSNQMPIKRFTKRFLFCSLLEQESVEIFIGIGPTNRLWLVGVDLKVPRYEGTPCLHFVRKVTPAEEIEESCGRGFFEDTWFAKGIGLVRLEQKVEGVFGFKKTSMVWTLVQFSKGTE